MEETVDVSEMEEGILVGPKSCTVEGLIPARRTCGSSVEGGRTLSGSLSIESMPRASK